MITIKVWGDYALFSRPEFKVERVSYPVITPSAARGVLEAIFWKPEFRYEIREIGVLEVGSQTTLLRNELSERQGRKPYFVEDVRQQRANLLLKNVAYLIRADMVLRPHATDPVPKYLSQLERRLERGQYHHVPYLGTREFAANFGVPDEGEQPNPKLSMSIGTMLFDIAFVEDAQRPEMAFVKHSSDGPQEVQGYAQALYFEAEVREGWMTVPQERYQDLYRLENHDAESLD